MPVARPVVTPVVQPLLMARKQGFVRIEHLRAAQLVLSDDTLKQQEAVRRVDFLAVATFRDLESSGALCVRRGSGSDQQTECWDTRAANAGG